MSVLAFGVGIGVAGAKDADGMGEYLAGHQAFPSVRILTVASHNCRARPCSNDSAARSPETALDALERIADMSSLATYGKHCMPLYNPTPQPEAFGNSTFRADLALKFHGKGGIWHRMDHLDAMSRITCPTLVLAGAHDPVTPIEDSEDMVRHLDPAIVTYVPFDNAGHGVWHDDPDRAFEVLRDFVTAV